MASGGEGRQILIVDDDPNILRFISESLRLHGYGVVGCADAEAALQALKKHDFSLALLDILLPGANGLELCRQLRSMPKTRSLPIIMMTAFYKQADQVREAREQYGATDYLLKPFPLKALHEKITALIGSPQQTPTGERLSISGRFAETPLPRILHNLYSLRATGLLHVEHNDIKKVVYIREGYPIFVRSNLVREFLGQILVRGGYLDEEGLKRSLDVAREQGQRHGTVLIEMGLISPQQLNEALHNQILEKLLDIFSWQDGSYRFMQARDFKPGVTTIDLSPANLIRQGLREYAGRDQVLRLLEPYLDQYPLLAENPLYRFQEIQLTAPEQRILASCQGQATLRDILKRHLLSRAEAEPLLATLLSTGILVCRSDQSPAETSPTAQADDGQRTKRESFLKDYAWMMEQDYFTLLGVSEADSREQVRKSYLNLVKKYHPDRFFEEDSLLDLKDKVNALFQRISDAHETLCDATAKARYVNERKGRGSASTTNLETLLAAETFFQKGMVFFRSRKYTEARKEFTAALELSPNEAEYLMYQAWSAYRAEPKSADVAANSRKGLIKALQLNPRLSLAHLYLGYISKDEGNEKEAQQRFEKAIQYNPHCTEALRELRLMSMRKEKTDKKGLFGKMFS